MNYLIKIINEIQCVKYKIQIKIIIDTFMLCNFFKASLNFSQIAIFKNNQINSKYYHCVQRSSAIKK